jgi:hypothetical protein
LSGQVVIFGHTANAGITQLDEKRGKFQRTRPIQARPLPLDQAWEPHYALSARDALEAAALRDFDPANARFGSQANITPSLGHVRSASESGHQTRQKKMMPPSACAQA